ncbi:MAG: glutathione peroxidase [Bacteroidota bacterium]
MQKLIIILVLFFTIELSAQNNRDMNIYDFSVPALEDGTINFEDYKDKKILIVNTASECGYTPQYKQLEELYKEMGDKVVVIGFPANNFGGQEPGSNEQIAAFCEKNYGVTFPMAAKVSVKGENQHELFAWLTSAENPDFKGDINWNFEKFLIDENGELIHRFRSGASPMDEAILSALED